MRSGSSPTLVAGGGPLAVHHHALRILCPTAIDTRKSPGSRAKPGADGSADRGRLQPRAPVYGLSEFGVGLGGGVYLDSRHNAQRSSGVSTTSQAFFYASGAACRRCAVQVFSLYTGRGTGMG